VDTNVFNNSKSHATFFPLMPNIFQKVRSFAFCLRKQLHLDEEAEEKVDEGNADNQCTEKVGRRKTQLHNTN